MLHRNLVTQYQSQQGLIAQLDNALPRALEVVGSMTQNRVFDKVPNIS